MSSAYIVGPSDSQTSSALIRRQLRGVLTDAATASTLSEEAAHSTESTFLTLREAKENDQRVGQAIMEQFGERGSTEEEEVEMQELPSPTGEDTEPAAKVRRSPNSYDREPSTSVVRFHVGDDLPEERPVPSAASVSLAVASPPTGRSGSRRVRKTLKQSYFSSEIDLSHISDPDIRAFLDPSNASVKTKDLVDWPQSKIDTLVDSIRSEHFPHILVQAVEDGTQAQAEPLTFSRIRYTDDKGTVRLQDVSGYLAPGEVVGIIAAPDAGASTLLDLLSGKLLGGSLDGSIKYKNQPPGVDYKKSIGFVDQSDLHLALLTVEETLFFSARLRLPSSIPDSLVRLRVQTVMALLGLSHVKDSLVGDEMVKGISGGQMRRLSVGVELTAGHSVLLADLPTNGLDSATAFELIRTFHHMVKAGLSMMCTVVQAGPELFQLFHRVIVMSKGSIIYSGPPSVAESYFKSLGFIRPKAKSIPQFLEELSAAPESFYHPTLARSPSIKPAVTPVLSAMMTPLDLTESFKADSKWLTPKPTEKPVETKPRTKKFYKEPTYSLNVESPTTKTSHKDESNLNTERVNAWNILNENYSTSVFYCEVRETLNELATSMSNATELAAHSDHHSSILGGYWDDRYNSTFGVQLRENFIRQAKLTYRNKSSWLHIWITSLIMGFMLGSLFYSDQLNESDIGIRSRIGIYFYMTSISSFNSFVILPVVLSQRRLFYQQTMHKFYHPTTYYLTFMAVQIFVVCIDILIMIIPIWGLSGLAGFPLSGQFWFGFLCILTCALSARQWIIFVCYLAPSEIIATTVLTVSFYMFALLSGEFIPEPVTVSGWRWAFNLSFVHWIFRSLVLNDYASDPYAEYVQSYLGWAVGEDSKWTTWENGLYFFIGFGVAAVITLTFVNWSRPAIPSASDFISRVAHTKEDDEEEETNGVEGESNDQLVAAKKKPSLPSRAAFLEFHHLDYTVHLPNGTDRMLLKQVYGYARPGRLVALMGKSGAGKSTLLDVLAGKKTGGFQSGPIKINGVDKEPISFARYSAYVEQFDSHDPLSTVREAIYFSGRLRLPSHLTESELNVKVDNVIDLLELRQVEQSIIGFPGMGGISMELRKKLTIAVEVITEPALLFLDEPTTGLDSHSAANVMKTIRSLAESISVICTIHQPPSELVAYFEDVLLIEGGKVVYFGDITQLPEFLHSVGAPKIAVGRNISDYALEVISDRNLFSVEPQVAKMPTGTEGDIEMAGVKAHKGDLSELFLNSPYAEHVRQFLAKGTNLDANEKLSEIDLSVVNEAESTSFFTQVSCLTIRFFNTSIRYRDSLMVRYLFAVLFGFNTGTVYFQLGTDQVEGQQRIAAIFFAVGHFLFSSSSFFPAIFADRVLYFRESTNRLYSPLAYFIARILGDLPHIVLEVFIPTLMIYFFSDLNQWDSYKFYGFFFWAMLIIRLTAIFFTQLVASVIAAPDFAYSVLATVMNVLFALTGFFIPYSQIPVWWQWLTQLDFLKFGLQFLALNEYRHQDWTCDPSGGDLTQVISAADSASYGLCDGRPIQTFPNPADSTGNTVLKCFYSCGYEMLDSLGIETTTDWQIQSFIILHCYGIFFAFAGYLALRFINHVKR